MGLRRNQQGASARKCPRNFVPGPGYGSIPKSGLRIWWYVNRAGFTAVSPGVSTGITLAETGA
jgi:hypothetical protein